MGRSKIRPTKNQTEKTLTSTGNSIFYHSIFLELITCDIMKFNDIPDSNRIDRIPDESQEIFSSENFTEQGLIIKKIEMRLYIEKENRCLITVFLQSDKGEVEMLYDEIKYEKNSLPNLTEFLMNQLGISSIITRTIIFLKSKIE